MNRKQLNGYSLSILGFIFTVSLLIGISLSYFSSIPVTIILADPDEIELITIFASVGGLFYFFAYMLKDRIKQHTCLSVAFICTSIILILLSSNFIKQYPPLNVLSIVFALQAIWFFVMGIASNTV